MGAPINRDKEKRRTRVRSATVNSARKRKGVDDSLWTFSSSGAARPPSFLIRQKWREIRVAHRKGRTETCNPKHRIRVSGPISSPPSIKSLTEEPTQGR